MVEHGEIFLRDQPAPGPPCPPGGSWSPARFGV